MVGPPAVKPAALKPAPWRTCAHDGPILARLQRGVGAVVNGVRIVSVGGMDCPCGGTHIRDTSELGKVTVEKVVAKGKVTRVSYSLEG